MKFSYRCFSCVALASIQMCSFAAEPESSSPHLIQSIVEGSMLPLIAEHDVPGLSVGITISGHSYFFNFGVASKESGVPVTTDTLFEIGSASKPFTGLLAAYAQALGKLSLEDSPSRFEPGLANTALGGVSLLHLATYTAGGLPLQFPDDVTDRQRALRYFQQWKPEASPGSVRRYSNPSIGLLGHLTGAALEAEFSDALEKNLFQELGLSHTFVNVPAHSMGHYAWGYNPENLEVRVNPGVFDAEAYGIKSTAADMVRFVDANIDPGTTHAELQKAIELTQLGYFAVGEMVQGLGWERYPYPTSLETLLAGNSREMVLLPGRAVALSPPQPPSGPALYNKTGSTGGFSAYVAFIPEKRTGIVMLANRNVPAAARITAAHEILERLTAAEAQ